MGKINFNKFNQQGFGLIEALVGMVVALIIILAFTTLISRAVVYNSINGKQLKATLYLQEMIEATKDLEQSSDGWNRLTTSTSPCYTICYPEISGSSWIVNSGTSTIDGIYTRSFMVEHVCRSTTTNEILTTPCNPADLEYSSTTKKVIAEIEWNDQLGPNHLELEAYLYNFNP